VVDEDASSLPDCPPLLTSLLGFDSPASWGPEIDAVNLLVQLAVSMRAHGRGGLLLVVPQASDEWLDSIVRPIPYAVVPAFAQLAHLNRQTPTRSASGSGRRPSTARGGGGGADSGRRATVLTTQFELLAFGAKIIRRKGSPQVSRSR